MLRQLDASADELGGDILMHVACGEVITCGDCSFRTRAGERPDLDIISATWRENTQRGGRYCSKAGAVASKGGSEEALTGGTFLSWDPALSSMGQVCAVVNCSRHTDVCPLIRTV